MSARAVAGRSRSPLTRTGLPSARTPHSEHRADGVVSVGELQPERLRDRPADHRFLLQAGEREGVLAAADHPPLAVAHEERGVRRGVVVVEQFEEEGKPALGAALRLAGEAEVAVELAGAVAAVGADEGMGHGRVHKE